MKYAAEFHVLSAVKLPITTPRLTFKHPLKDWVIEFWNLVESQHGSSPSIALAMYFDSDNLRSARELAEDASLELLDVLSYVTGSRFESPLISKVVEWDSGLVERKAILVRREIGRSDAMPVLDQTFMDSMEVFLASEPNPAIKRALRWYRMGLRGEHHEDIFQFFWFGLEILSEACKERVKVKDKCPKCKKDLYCESCKDYPSHYPYPKQAIKELIRQVLIEPDPELAFSWLDKARNTLMHGGYLKDIQDEIPFPSNHLVDLLGSIIRDSIFHLYPKNQHDKTATIGYPDTYQNIVMSASILVSTVIPLTEDGKLELTNFPDIQIKITPTPWPDPMIQNPGSTDC